MLGSRKTAGGLLAALSAVTIISGCAVSTGGGVNNQADSENPAQSQAPGATATASSSSAPSVAHLGQAITIGGNDEGAKVTVTAVRYRATARSTDGYSTPETGKRFAAVQFKIVNSGTAAYDDAPSNGATVADDQGQQFEADIVTETNAGPNLPATTKIAPGGSALGFIVFQVPKAAKITKVQFGTDSGFGETAEWTIP